MIKIITIITKFIVITLIALFFGSCNRMVGLKSIVGSGNVTTENRNVQGDFKSVEVSNALDLVIEQSNTTEIIIEADDNLQKEITTNVENGVLVIACNYNSFVNIKSKKITVKMPVIDGIEASSASTVKSRNTLKGDHISLSSSSAATIKVSTEFETVESESSSGSTTTITGKALNLETSASSGSIINATDLLANSVIADASSGGSIIVHPIVNLKADASSGSNIDYTTVPKSIQKNATSGGSISKI